MRVSHPHVLVLLIGIAVLLVLGFGLSQLIKPARSAAYDLTYGQLGQHGTRLIDLDTGEHFAVKNAPAWDWRRQAYPSPDGHWVARWTLLIENYWWRLDLEDATTGQVRTIGEFSACDARAAWSPDSRMVALSFIADPGDPDSLVNFAAGSHCGIHLFSLDTGQMTRITDRGYAAFDPAFSPYGDQLVYSSSEDGFNRLYIMTLATGERRLLTPQTFGYRAAWSPDGQWIAFMSNHEDWNDDIYIIAPDGSDLQRLTTSASPDDHPQWVQAGSVAIDGQS